MRFIQKDAEEKKASFNPRPYFRLFVNWLLDLGSLDPVVDGANFQVWFKWIAARVFCLCFVIIVYADSLMLVVYVADLVSICKCI